MATSQNGYRANDRSLIASYKVPGGKISMRKGDVATVLSYVANRFHSEVEPLKWPGNWGYAERKIRGGSSLSNHASGTAIDLNAPAHYLGARGTFSAKQVRAIRRILNDCGGVIRWGGDYRGRKDEMHFEINAGTAAVARVAKAIRAGKKPGPSGGAVSGGGSSSPTYKTVSGSTPLVKLYHKGEPVKRIQVAVGVKADSYYGPSTVKAVKKWQKANGLAADGIFGDKSWGVLNGGKAKKPSSPKKSSAPKFPFPKGHWMGVESSNPKNHSGYHARDRSGIKVWQSRMKARGWTITVDGRFGPQSERVAKQFQKQVKVAQDGLVGEVTFKKSWTAPIT